MTNPFSLEGKNIFITGASSGIGRCCAITASQLGATVILVGRNEERLKETLSNLQPGKHVFFSQDIVEYDKLQSLVVESVKQVGQINGFIHSAGVEMTVPFNNMKMEYYQNLFSVNVFSGFELMKNIAKRRHVNSAGGSFVIISSIMGVVGQTGKVGYCSAKGAVISGVKALAVEFAPRNIRVNCISPAIVETEMTKSLFETISYESVQTIIKMHPLGLGKPEDIAYAAAFLLSDAARWITGINLIADGGYSSS